MLREGITEIDPRLLDRCAVRSGMLFRDFVAGAYEQTYTLSFLASPATFEREPAFLVCYPGWKGYRPIHRSASLLDFLAQHELSLAPAVRGLARLDLDAIARLPRPIDRAFAVMSSFDDAEKASFDELVRVHAHESFWLGRQAKATDAMALIGAAFARVGDPKHVLECVLPLVKSSRLWSRAW